MAIKLNAILRNALLDYLGSLLLGTLSVYSGPEPTVDGAATGTLLVSWDLSAVTWGAASNGSVSISGMPLTSAAVADGDAGYFRLVAGTNRYQGGVSAASGDMVVNTLTMQNGVNVDLTEFTIPLPESA